MTSLENYVVFVPNTIAPYGYELVQILALPEDFRFRFRFSEEWVQEKVRSRLSDLSGRPGYILLRDFDGRELYPIRHLTIERALKVGQMYYFEYRLGALVEVDSDPVYRAKQLDDFRSGFESFHSSIASSNKSHKDMKPLVFLSNFELEFTNDHFAASDTVDRESECWGNILACMTNVDFYKGVEFLRVLGIRPMSPGTGHAKFSEGSAKLRERADYAIDIVQFVPHGDLPRHQPNDIRISTDGKVLQVIKEEQRAVGKYDLLTFYFRANSFRGARNSFVNIEHSALAKSEDEQYVEPNLLLPATISVSFRRLAISSLIAAAFVLLYFAPDIVTAALADYQSLIKDASIVGLSVSIVDVILELRERLNRQ